jgi:hypothetical protein
MRKGILLIVLAMSLGLAKAQKPDTWNTLAKTKFEPKYSEKLAEYIFSPSFPAELKALDGKEVSIEGFYVPFGPEDGNYIILSKYPMSQCFFCGGGGPESIVEVYIPNGNKFQPDDMLNVKGKLKLNADDPDHLTFMLQSASLVSK